MTVLTNQVIFVPPPETILSFLYQSVLSQHLYALVNSEALLACSEALPAGSGSLPLTLEAFPAASDTLATGSKALSMVFGTPSCF